MPPPYLLCIPTSRFPPHQHHDRTTPGATHPSLSTTYTPPPPLSEFFFSSAMSHRRRTISTTVVPDTNAANPALADSLNTEEKPDYQAISIVSLPESATPISLVPEPNGPTPLPTDTTATPESHPADQPPQPPLASDTQNELSTIPAAPKLRPKFSDLKDEHGTSTALLRFCIGFFKHNWGILLFVFIIALALAMLGIFAYEPLSWQAWASYAILVGVLALLITNTFPVVMTMLLGLTIMLLLKIVTPEEGIVGFSNTGVMAVAVLFTIAEGIQRTSVLQPFFRLILGKPRWLWEAQLRVMVPVGLISAFLNNTPVVAMLIPVLQSWSRRSGIPVSKVLMPMNNAAILGGTLTLLGTSTNLVVNGLAKESGILGKDANGTSIGLPIFGVTPVGAAMFVAGVIYMAIFARYLLRDRGQTGVDAIIQNPREYTVALLVQKRSPIVGETVQEAGLRHLKGLFLIEITRDDGTLIPAVAPDTKIEAGDVLLFAGVVETVTELYHIPGIVPATGQSQKMKIERHHRRLVEVVISASSTLVGKTPKEAEFRSRFSAAIIAVHRHGEHVRERIGDITLRAGDTLLLESGSDFVAKYGKDFNFALLSEVSGSQPPREDRLHMVIAATIAVAMVALATAGVVPLLSAAAGAAFLMIATRCLSATNAARSIDFPVVIAIAASFGISKGLENTGAAEQLGEFIVNMFRPIGHVGLLFGIYVGTALLSSVITNNAAVTLMFPVIKSIIARSDDISTLAALYALMVGASASFSTPIGYQTNLMVHGPGGYTFMDWVVFGLPMQVILAIVSVLTITALF